MTKNLRALWVLAALSFAGIVHAAPVERGTLSLCRRAPV
jgi:hypothetical protein